MDRIWSNISFNKSSLQGRELEYIFQTINAGQIAGDQLFSTKCQSFLEKTLGVNRALVTTSCTHALEMAALLLEIRPGDEIILPSFTFVSTANAFLLHGAKPVFCDIRPDTMNLDENILDSLVTIKTKAIIPVHYAGVACEMDRILQIAKKTNISVVEDNAHGLFGKFKGRWLGTIGTLATQSFHETKNITCGEGGALLINDSKFAHRAEILREKGTNRAQFFRGQVDKYTWVDIGSSYVMSDVLAAFLYGQLEQWQMVQEKRKTIWETYDKELKQWTKQLDIKQPFVPDYCDQAYHMYYLVLPSLSERTRFISHLKSNDIMSVFHYQPLHCSPMGKSFGGTLGQCPVSERMGDCLVRLPFYNSFTREDQQRVIETILTFKG